MIIIIAALVILIIIIFLLSCSPAMTGWLDKGRGQDPRALSGAHPRARDAAGRNAGFRPCSRGVAYHRMGFSCRCHVNFLGLPMVGIFLFIFFWKWSWYTVFPIFFWGGWRTITSKIVLVTLYGCEQPEHSSVWPTTTSSHSRDSMKIKVPFVDP